MENPRAVGRLGRLLAVGPSGWPGWELGQTCYQIEMQSADQELFDGLSRVTHGPTWVHSICMAMCCTMSDAVVVVRVQL